MLIGRPFQQVIRPGEILDRKDNDRKDCRSRHSRSLTVAGLHLPRYPSKRSGVFLHRSPHHGMTTVSPAEWHKRYGTRDKSQDLSPSRMWPPPNPIPGKKRCLVPDQCHSKNQGYPGTLLFLLHPEEFNRRGAPLSRVYPDAKTDCAISPVHGHAKRNDKNYS